MLIELLIVNNIDQIHQIQQRLQFSINFEWYTLADITVQYQPPCGSPIRHHREVLLIETMLGH
jgi:hypothetical protein